VYGSLRGRSLVKEKGILNLVALTGIMLMAKMSSSIEINTKRDLAIDSSFAPQTWVCVMTVSMMKPTLKAMSLQCKACRLAYNATQGAWSWIQQGLESTRLGE